MPVASRFARKLPSNSPTVGKFCTPEKPISLSCLRKTGISRKGSVPQTPASTGVFFTTGKHLAGHLDDDAVGVAVGHQAGERAAPGHAVAPGVVDDDEVGAARLGALGGDAGAGAAADDGLTCRRLGAKRF